MKRRYKQKRTPRTEVADAAPPMVSTPAEFEKAVHIPLEQIRRFGRQPREYFAGIEGLAASINAVGQIVAGVVRPIRSENGSPYRYELVDGERRFRACRLAGRPTFKAEIENLADEGRQFEVSVAANFNREDHGPMEKARAVHRLRHEFGRSVKYIADICGKTEPWVYQHLSLVKLDGDVQAMLDPSLPRDERLTFSVSLMLASLSPEQQRELAKQIIEGKLGEKEAQHLIRRTADTHPTAKSRSKRPSRRFDLFRGFVSRTLRETTIWNTQYDEQYFHDMMMGRQAYDRAKLTADLQTAISNLQWLKDAINQPTAGTEGASTPPSARAAS